MHQVVQSRSGIVDNSVITLLRSSTPWESKEASKRARHDTNAIATATATTTLADMTSFSPTRLRSRSFLNNPPGYNPDVPGHSILLNSTDRLDSDRPSDQGGQRAPSPHRSISTTSSHASNTNSSQSHGYGYAHSEADFTGSKASSGSVSFAPLPVIPPELKRRSSITLGVAARKNLLSSPEDEIYPDPRRAGAGAGAGSGSGAGAAGGAGGKSKGNGAVKAVYMNDQDWEEYKRQHDVKNG